jgi:hypothetical protein
LDTVRRVAGFGDEFEVRLRSRGPGEPGTAPWVLLAVRGGPNDDDPDPDWVFPGLDDPPTGWFAGVDGPIPERTASTAIEPVTVLTRWRDAIARQGRRALTGTNRDALERDITWLRSRASGHRAEVLHRLANAADGGSHDFDGSFRADPGALRPARTALVVVS